LRLDRRVLLRYPEYVYDIGSLDARLRLSEPNARRLINGIVQGAARPEAGEARVRT
jgi:hypothetical protein